MSSQYEKIVGDFKPGSIICLKLKNFLTYTKVEIRPGPRMNMVIGANGTGKSSILCALCLGLGGEPKLLGRADDARSFIMHEQEKAQISVTLAPFPGEEPHELIRVIDRSKGSDRGNGRGASTFFINKQKASIKEVQQLVRETYKIAVDNLCQFLPQDLVGSFSGFNQKQLLIETEKSIGGDSMYNKHQNLIKYEKEQQSGDSNVDSIKAKLEKLESEKQRFEREKERMEERNKALQQVEQHRKVIAWKDMQNKLEEYHRLKEERKRLKQEYKQAMQECQPFEERVVELEERKRGAEALFKKQDQQVGKHKAEMEKQQIKNEKHEDEMDNALLELQKVETDRAKKLQEVKAQKAKVDLLKQNLDEIGRTEEEVTLEFNEAAKLKQKAHKACAHAREEARKLANEFKEHEGNAEQVSSRLAKLQDEKAQRKQHLYRQQPNLAKICGWLDQNRKIFRRQVWGPVAVEVSLKTANAAAYLEQHCANTVLTSFVVESKEDYDRLYKEVRSNLRLPVNVILVRNGRLQDITRPIGEEKMAELKRNHGVIGYLDEAFKAPDAVLEALRAMSAVHRVLVGGDETQRSIDERGLLEFLAEPDQKHGQRGKQGSCIFASKNHSSKKYTQSVSRYSGHISSRDDDVKPARLLAKGGDPAVKTRLEMDLKALHDSMNALRPKIEDADRKKDQLEKAGQKASQCTSEAKDKLETFKKYKSKLSNATKKLKDAEKDLSTDDRSLKRKLLKVIMTRVGNIVSALEGHAASHEKLLETTISSAALRIEKDSMIQMERIARDELENKLQATKELEQRAVEANDQYKVMQAKAKEAMEHQLETDDQGKLVDEELQALSEQEIEDLEAALEDAEQKVNSIHNDPNAIKQYEANEREIEEVTEQLRKVEDHKSGLGRKIEQELSSWKAGLLNATQKINERFVRYMSELSVTGEVRLKRGGESGNEDCDFKDWGIEIRVSFREGVKAQVLSAQVQSGGERSVSTILFLMAMQDLMPSPFRCVDEINQGMDERNERAIFKRIVQNSTGAPKESPTDHCGQYFLITPKLLPSLLDMEQEAVTVLVVMNGPYNFDKPTDFNVNKIVAAARARRTNKRLSVDPEEDEENQENVIATSNRRGAKKKKRRSN